MSNNIGTPEFRTEEQATEKGLKLIKKKFNGNRPVNQLLIYWVNRLNRRVTDSERILVSTD